MDTITILRLGIHAIGAMLLIFNCGIVPVFLWHARRLSLWTDLRRILLTLSVAFLGAGVVNIARLLITLSGPDAPYMEAARWVDAVSGLATSLILILAATQMFNLFMGYHFSFSQLTHLHPARPSTQPAARDSVNS